MSSADSDPFSSGLQCQICAQPVHLPTILHFDMGPQSLFSKLDGCRLCPRCCLSAIWLVSRIDPAGPMPPPDQSNPILTSYSSAAPATITVSRPAPEPR